MDWIGGDCGGVCREGWVDEREGEERGEWIGFGWIAGNRKEGGEGKERVVSVERRMEWKEKEMGFGNRSEIGESGFVDCEW